MKPDYFSFFIAFQNQENCQQRYKLFWFIKVKSHGSKDVSESLFGND